METVLAYITTKDKEQARNIGRALVTKRLAACVNILDAMESLYWWEGKIDESREAVLIAKTDRALVDKLTAVVKSLHSYDCPCVLVLPVQGGSEPYLAWLKASLYPGKP